MHGIQPTYLELLHEHTLQERAQQAHELMKDCVLCARLCRVNRYETHGVCRTGAQARVASYGAHHGEEDPLRGWNGSGTIFFSSCNLQCQYCQNHAISQHQRGQLFSAEDLAACMLTLQASGCHNINFVSPSHVVAPILDALVIAAKRGLRIPLVYNTGGYDSLEALRLLDGVIDIYMPDMKYSDSKIGLRLSKVKNYPQVNCIAVKEMHLQVGDLQMDERGIAMRGLLVRHLVLPNQQAGTAKIVRFLAEEISPNTYVNIMAQYRPAYKAHEIPAINRALEHREYQHALNLAQNAGLHRLDRR